MIKWDPNKEKKLTFSLVVEGIDPNSLTYTLRLSENGRDYGFTGKNNNDEVTVIIPPLSSILKNDRISELKTVRLDINDSDDKYYMKPFEDTILIEKSPDVSVSIKENIDEKKDEKIKVSIKEDIDSSVKKKSILRDKLELSEEKKKEDKKKRSILRDRLENIS